MAARSCTLAGVDDFTLVVVALPFALLLKNEKPLTIASNKRKKKQNIVDFANK
jgi:hypothetical protein